MADDRADSFESDETSAAPSGGATAARVDGVGNLGEDRPGEDLASPLLPDDVEYVISPDETEAEELEGVEYDAPDEAMGDESDVVIDDPAQLDEATDQARVARSSRPVKRATPVEAELGDEPSLVMPAAASLRPRRRTGEVAKKGHATPTRDHTPEVVKTRVGPVQFVREAADELRKVVWPNGSQLWQYFVVVLVFVLFIIAFVSLLDYAFGLALIKLFG